MQHNLVARLPIGALSLSAALFAAPAQAELSANLTVTNNYLWRGLTQTSNDAAVQGGIDYSHESGFYAGTWVSNVNFGADDAYSYEHNLYAGFAGELKGFSYDLGYLYYNYDDNAGFDFSEVHGSLSIANLSLSLSLLAHAEPDEARGQDFGFGKAGYLAIDYLIPLARGTELGLHLGYHEGDFMEAFNGVNDSYFDYSISLGRSGFLFTLSHTDLNNSHPASTPAYDNDELKFVASYSLDLAL